MSAASDRLRSTTVAVFAVAQVLSAPLTSLALGPSSDQGPISDANLSPVTPAGYAFAIWGLIYLASLALAAYQVLPSQQARRVHRTTGWWLAGAFAASTVWVPIFGSQTIWLSQLVIITWWSAWPWPPTGSPGWDRPRRPPNATCSGCRSRLPGLGDAGLFRRVRDDVPVPRHAG